MLSKVSGYLYGTAKRTSNVVVQCKAAVSPECYQAALTMIYDDIYKDPDNPIQNAVVLMSLYWDTTFIANNGGQTVCRSRNTVYLRKAGLMLGFTVD